jgi:Rrf2 family transcriptional regulator, iron-sulfur cluster assembly transcription factor|tara:strand:- start:167 stop:619 length:453 start_codon:yes stop_codon:yes gene_type:complete
LFRVSRKIIYAIEAVVDIAYYSGLKPVQNIEIAKRQGIPKRYLEQTLQTLVRSKILIGSRGPRGGYRLAKERRKIKISDIIKSFDQDSENNIKDKLMVSEISEKIINPLILDVYDTCFEKLKKTSIEDICKKARESKIKKISTGNVDFVI